MNPLDVILLVLAVIFTVSGYRQGFIVGALSFAGFIGGGVLGVLGAPLLVGGWQPGLGQAVIAVAVVIVAAMLGQALASLVGSAVRRHVTWRPARLVDATLGAGLSLLAMLVVAWFLSSALRVAPFPTLSRQIRNSAVITAVDRHMPEVARGLFGPFRTLLDANGFPQVFGGLSPERILPVQPPPSDAGVSPGVRAAAKSIVRIVGTAASCSRQVEGSGFVYAPHRVMTNAHVVAGVRAPGVQVRGMGPMYAGRVVVFDPRRDLAVIYVPGLGAPPLHFGGPAARGATAAVAGFPLDGPYEVGPARVREAIAARGSDIYHTDQVTRQVYSLFADVQPGNSGGPLLSPQGNVYGVVFAKSLDDPSTGYALTAVEAEQAAGAGGGGTARVPTGACA